MEFSEKELSILTALQKSKSRIVLLFKWRYPFFTQLENFQKPADCGLIGVFSTALKGRLFVGYEKHFDLIIWFEADFSAVKNAYCGEETIQIKELDQIVGEVVKLIEPQKLRFLECEEATMDAACKTRQRFGIPGARPGDLDYLRDKSRLKDACRRHGIPTARFAIVDFEKKEKLDETIKRIEMQVGKYPMFCKPTGGFGTGGGQMIRNSVDLHKFLVSEDGKQTTYLVEECVQTREFWASVVLLQNGEWRPLNVLHCGNRTSRQNLDDGQPIPFIAFKFEKAEQHEFPSMSKFVDLVIRTLKPPVPHVFCVQGFQLTPGKNDYLFTECGYRLNGARGCGISYKAAGISQETAFLLAYMDPNYDPVPDPVHRTTTASIWYPSRKGTLQSHSQPSTVNFQSKIRFFWYLPVGSKLNVATSYNDFVSSVEVEHENQKVMEKELKWLMENWTLDIV
ncbi:ATP-grasp domain-containing protein [Aphelenchoides besseyi]|nr:ATP-grasp domain-containing protein [Aphelenchoides besseyi]KAI6193631.1 ATP-grasp domain-containing protein [Aphelenchoides besseyi]